jgi:predicted membrane channel-forming protein YqfA (hemolysin III family)
LCFGVSITQIFFQVAADFVAPFGVIPLPVAIYYRDRVGDFGALATMLYALTGWSVLLFVTTLIAFSYIEAMPFKQHVPEDWSES